MSELASASQLRMSFVRWAIVTVPLVVLLGFVAGRIGGAGYENPWFDALHKPPLIPPGWVFGTVWATLYTMQGFAIALVLNARGNSFRSVAITLFVIQLLLNYIWSPLFFAAHEVLAAFVVIIAMLGIAAAATFVFGRVRSVAAWLMVPYLVWLCLASILNWQVHELNPNARTLVPGGTATQIYLE